MRRVVMVCLAVALLPTAGDAQIEIGFDTGLNLNLATPNQTTFSIPVAMVRAGYALENGMVVEPLVAFRLASSGGTTTNAITLIPGLVYFISESAARRTYVRGEAGFTRFGGGGGSATQWTLGGAVGFRQELQESVFWRLEGGLARWFANTGALLGAFTQLRALAGVSIALN